MTAAYEPTIGDAVLIRWVDAITDAGWTAIRDADQKPHDCTTVGILIHQNDLSITVALTAGGDQVNGTIAIPAGWIDEMTVIKRKAFA